MQKIQKIRDEANYCLNCKVKPCSKKGCPLSNNIPEFIQQIKKENYEKAYEILSETTVLPGVCGKICPHFKQCQGSCIRGIKGEPVSIGKLESFVFEQAMEKGVTLKKCWEKQINQNKKENEQKRVAVIGGGPSGLTASAFLAKSGIKVTIYEKYSYLGGLLIYGIPEFRLPKQEVKKTINNILELGIEVKYNQELGKNLNLEDLKEEYDAILLGFGANVSCKMGVEGEKLQGVFGGNELLEYNRHPNYKGMYVAVIGGGNVAMDCARTIKRLGAKEVTVIYRRAREQMPAENKEIKDAMDEGIKFLFQNNIVKIIGNDKVKELELIETKLIQKDSETRLVPVNIENSNYKISMDYIVMALGSEPATFVQKLGLKLDKWGNIKIDENYQTSDSKIYACGDLAGIRKTVAWAAYSGKEAANKIIEKIK